MNIDDIILQIPAPTLAIYLRSPPFPGLHLCAWGDPNPSIAAICAWQMVVDLWWFMLLYSKYVFLYHDYAHLCISMYACIGIFPLWMARTGVLAIHSICCPGMNRKLPAGPRLSACIGLTKKRTKGLLWGDTWYQGNHRWTRNMFCLELRWYFRCARLRWALRRWI